MIDNNLKKSDWILKGMKSTFGFVKTMFTKAPKTKFNKDYELEQKRVLKGIA